MKLIDVTEPLFQYVCMLRRLGANGADYSYDKAHSDVIKIFNNIEHKVSQDRVLGFQYSRVKLPLMFFTDSMITESGISFASLWDDNRLAYDYSEMTGDDMFFKMLEEILEDRVNFQRDCLHIFYTCIGLGFKGIYKNDPNKLKQIMWKIADFLPEVFDKEGEFLIENDSHTETNVSKVPFFMSFWRPKTFVVVVVVLLFVWLLSNLFLYIGASSEANKVFKNVNIERLMVNG